MPTPTTWSDSFFSELTGVTDVDSLIGGTQWTSNTISFSFPGANAVWSTEEFSGYGPTDGAGEPWSEDYGGLLGTQKDAVRDALELWANVANLTFVESVDNANTVGDLRFAFTGDAAVGGAQAVGYFPSSAAASGDVWFNAASSSAEELWAPGSWEFMTAMHEIGHALGFKHPFDALPSPFNDTVIDPALDSRSFTVMSYSAAPGDFNTYFTLEPTTPMVLDVVALQSLYGANTTFHAGNDTYRFVGGSAYHETIWDAGGRDTIVLDSTAAGVIDLRAGLFGSQLGDPLNVLDSFSEVLYEANNVWIAFGTVIENATGGSGADLITGNVARNVLNGGGGADTLSGGGGADTLNGGLGVDSLKGGIGNDTYTVTSGDKVVEALNQGVDRVSSSGNWTLTANVDNLTLSGAGNVNGTGNKLANTLIGNAGNNVLKGVAGNDTLTGGSGADVFGFDTALSDATNVDLITDFAVGVDKVRLDDDIFTALIGGNAISAAQFLAAPGANAAVEADDRIVYDTSSGALYYDADGLNGVAAVRFAVLGSSVHPTLGAGDFLVVG